MENCLPNRYHPPKANLALRKSHANLVGNAPRPSHPRLNPYPTKKVHKRRKAPLPNPKNRAIHHFFKPLLPHKINFSPKKFGQFTQRQYLCTRLTANNRFDSLAQQVEHNTFNVGVLGSSPRRITERRDLKKSLSFLSLNRSTINHHHLQSSNDHPWRTPHVE